METMQKKLFTPMKTMIQVRVYLAVVFLFCEKDFKERLLIPNVREHTVHVM